MTPDKPRVKIGFMLVELLAVLTIIGSAAGVVVMGLEKMSFGWYMRHISWIALAGYLAGMLCYWVERTIFF